MCSLIFLWKAFSSIPIYQIFMTKVADLHWMAVDHIYHPSGASSRLDFILAVSRWWASPATSMEAGREREDTLGSHPRVSLITTGRAGRGESKRLLTSMIQVCFLSPPP